MSLFPSAHKDSRAKDRAFEDSVEYSTLAAARARDVVKISTISEDCPAELAQRLYDLGFRENATVECVRCAPMGSPLMFRVCDTDLCLRKAQAKFVLLHSEQQGANQGVAQ